MTVPTFDSLMEDAQDSIMDLLGSDDTVIFRARGSETERPDLQAIVYYPDDQSGSPEKYHPTGTPRIWVTLYNDATTGISVTSDHPVIGGSIKVKPEPGAAAKWCTIRKRIETTHNLVVWECY